MTGRNQGVTWNRSLSRAARRERRRDALHQFCNTSGLQAELSEPCNPTHVRNLSDKARQLFAKVLSPAQAATRDVGRAEVSLAAIDDVMARSSLLLTSRMPPARSMLLVL